MGDDIFVGDEKKKEEEFIAPLKSPEPKEFSSKKIIPREYIPVKLNSLGKLHAPAIIHVRNYNMEDALELSLVDEETALETTMYILNKMIYESFDPVYLHVEELKEILLTVYSNFWSSTLSEFLYPYENEELEFTDFESKERIIAGKQTPNVDIPIKLIKTDVIHKDFKEPIKIKVKNKEVYFRLSRIKDVLESKEYIEKKYLAKEKEFSNVSSQLNSEIESERNKVPEDVRLKYEAYTKKRNFDLVKAIQCQVLIKAFGKKLNTLNEKLKYYTKVDIEFWKAYNRVIEKYATFGINPEVEVKSPLTGKLIIRRFQFRYLDFLRALDVQNDNAYTVSFGE